MKRWTTVMALVMLFVPSMASAQHRPYSDLQARAVKALSDQQTTDLGAGRGMELALAAELNGYPGPCRSWNSHHPWL